ncbi:MAG: hypothetical protein AABO57_08770 [Acidobacteriota bacterium]
MDEGICQEHKADEKTLKSLTQEYWETFESGKLKPRLERYVDDLLNEEMCWANDSPLPDNRSRLPQQEYQLLAMLVGFSVEPLLQTVWAYEPQQVLLLLNQAYGDLEEGGMRGEDFGEMVKSLIQDHLSVKKPLKRKPQVDCEIVNADPASVFRRLREKVSVTEGVIIDITGAKKSMVAGAFLYAAYANVPVSYVDFDDDAYDPERGRPYGYKCRIGSLSNPYQAFALRDWELVRELYNQYNFRAARTLLVGRDGSGSVGTILATARIYLPEMEEPMNRLGRMLYCYELWESGEFNAAQVEANTINQEGWNTEFPNTVTDLGGSWFSFSGGEISQSVSSFYDDTPELRAYVYDEIKRVERLIYLNEDCNSAFLRVAGVNEVLMIARVVKLVSNQVDKRSLLSALDRETPGAYSVYEALLKPDNSTIEIGRERRTKDLSFRSAPQLSVALPRRMSEWWQQNHHFKDFRDKDSIDVRGWEHFLRIRNKLTHTHLTVPPYLAEDALRFVTANFEDFLGYSMELLSLCAEDLKWSQLCQRCGLADLLPPSLKEDK